MYSQLQQKLAAGEIIIIDGATGTELEKRDVPMDQDSWSSIANVTHPAEIQAIHESYIRAGADVIITNTFGTSRQVLEPAGLGDQFEAMNRSAARAALAARIACNAPHVAVAGAISDARFKFEKATNAVVRKNWEDQVQIFVEEGVDMIMLEMMRDVEHTAIAIEVAQAAGLPVWCGFSVKADDNGELVLYYTHTPTEGKLIDIVEAIAPKKPDAMLVMHTLTEHTAQCLEDIKAHWDGPFGAFPHSGHFVRPKWFFEGIISPAEFTDQAVQWAYQGARIIGGCCGIGPAHIEALVAEFKAD